MIIWMFCINIIITFCFVLSSFPPKQHPQRKFILHSNWSARHRLLPKKNYAIKTTVPPVLEPFSFGSTTASVTSQTTSTSYNKAKEGSSSHVLGETIHTSVLSSSTRAAGSRTRVICGLARGDLPVHFQWRKDGIPLTTKTTPTSNNFLPAFYNNNAKNNLFHTSNSDFKISRNERKLRLHASATTMTRFNPDTIKITTIDAFSSLLTISSLGDEHTGNYTCVATNPAGHAQYTASLTVKGDFWQRFPSFFYSTSFLFFFHYFCFNLFIDLLTL